MSYVGGDDSLRRALQTAVGRQYTIIRLLGRGGMGAVYLARDTLERLVAIKVILPHAFAVPGARERFRREMRTVARFAHPNIVPIYASGELDELDWFVMMYVSGDTVAERLRQEGRVPAEDGRRILVELADALHYAHGLSVIHRDIKPANVLIDDMSGRAFLTDFGVAKTLTGADTHSTATVAGTLGYMPPEAFNDGKVDHRADIYALGVLGYEMIAGRRPVGGDNAVQIMFNTVNTPPAHLTAVADDVPPDLASVLMRCLAKAPDDRFRDARHLRGALGLKEADEATMPQDLRDMAGFGSWTLLWIAVWGTLGLRELDRLLFGIPLLIIALIVPIGFALQVAGMRPAGLPIAQIARVAFWPPKWWGMWWPRRLRRPVDLWPRLPLRAKLTRVALSALLIVVPALILLAAGKDRIGAELPSVLPALGIAIALLGSGALVVLTDAALWAHREKLDQREAIRMLIGPTIVSRLWDAPSMSRLLTHRHLSTEPGVDEAPEHPRACLDRVKRLSQSLAGRSRETGAMAMSAARELCSEIDALDVEISLLTDDSNADVMARLEVELADLPPALREDGPESRLRRPIARELQRLRDVAARLDVATQERGRLFRTQQALWRDLVSLSFLDPDDVVADAARARIRRLCAGVENADAERGVIEEIYRSVPSDPARAVPPLTPRS